VCVCVSVRICVRALIIGSAACVFTCIFTHTYTYDVYQSHSHRCNQKESTTCRYLALPHKLHPVKCGSTIFSNAVPEHVVHLQTDEPQDTRPSVDPERDPHPDVAPTAALEEKAAVSDTARIVAKSTGDSNKTRVVDDHFMSYNTSLQQLPAACNSRNSCKGTNIVCGWFMDRK